LLFSIVQTGMGKIRQENKEGKMNERYKENKKHGKGGGARIEISLNKLRRKDGNSPNSFEGRMAKEIKIHGCCSMCV